MRDYGRVSTRFWSSPTTKAMSGDARHLSLYLMTSPHSTIAGVFRLPLAYAADDLDWTSERVSEALRELSDVGFARYCSATKWLWTVNHFRWNPLDNPNQRKAARKIAEQVPTECAWHADFERTSEPHIAGHSAGAANGSETLGEPSSNQEQELVNRSTLSARRARPLTQRAAKTGSDAFESFWELYPRKSGKAAALRAFEALNPDAAILVLMREALGNASRSDEWQRDAGRYVPSAEKWLRDRRWEDDDRRTGPARSTPPSLGTGAMLAELERHGKESQSPEAHEARRKALESVEKLRAAVAENARPRALTGLQ